MTVLKDILMKKVPVYVYVIFLIIWTVSLVGCSIIPTSYTTNAEQKNLVRQNTLLQIELFRRFEGMDPAKRTQFMIENVKFAILIEEIICGGVTESGKLFETVIEAQKKTATEQPK